jgi:hypothetical protein
MKVSSTEVRLSRISQSFHVFRFRIFFESPTNEQTFGFLYCTLHTISMAIPCVRQSTSTHKAWHVLIIQTVQIEETE